MSLSGAAYKKGIATGPVVNEGHQMYVFNLNLARDISKPG